MTDNATNANIPQPSAPFLLGRPEPISPVWWAFLLSLFQRTGGGGSPPVDTITIDDVFAIETVSGTPALPIEIERSMILADAHNANYLPEMVFALAGDTASAQAPSAVTVGASPFTYVATSRQAVHIVGGTISSASYARGATSLPLGIVAGGQILEMNAGDALTITYTSAPTITVIPR